MSFDYYPFECALYYHNRIGYKATAIELVRGDSNGNAKLNVSKNNINFTDRIEVQLSKYKYKYLQYGFLLKFIFMDDKINKTLHYDLNHALNIGALDAIPFQTQLFDNVLITSGPASHRLDSESF